MTEQPNPWVARFDHIDREYLRRRMALQPKRLRVAVGKVAQTDIDRLADRFEQVFVPTEQCLDLAEYLVALARSHSERMYPSITAYRRGIYMKDDAPLPERCFPVNLTGLAGVGKSKLIERLGVVLNEITTVHVPLHGPTEQVIMWQTKIGERISPTELLRNLMRRDGFPDELNVNKARLELCRQRAYKRGLALVAMDEAAFQGTTSTSNALAANTLRNLMKIGVPNVFVSNFSLCHRLWGRPEQERQRLLGNPRSLLPDPHDGNDWLETVVAFQSVAPNLYKFDAETCAEQIHFWTAGAKRRLGQLLLIAAGLAGAAKKPVVLKTIEKAYKSPAYTANREDIGLLYQQATSGCTAKKTRKDLYSPFPLSESESQQLASSAQAADESAVTQEYLDSTMTPEEKRRFKAIQKAQAQNDGTKATVTPIRPSLSKMEALEAGDEQFRNEE